jgi:3-oxoadipate enol-lactonase
MPHLCQMLRPDPAAWVLLLAGVVAAQPHTDPSRWEEPRIYHTQEQSQLDKRILIEKSGYPAALLEPVHSPNGAYYFMVMRPNTAETWPCTTSVFVYSERDSLVQITLADHYLNFSPTVSWVNEKLLLLRVWWGRIVGTDVIYDVEREKIIYEESFHDGTLLFEQRLESSAGEVPGDAAAGEADVISPAPLVPGFADVNGAHLYYEVRGDGYPLLLLHAGVGDMRMWDAQAEEFAKQYTVVRPDLRGFGRSALVPGEFSYYEDVAALLEFLGIKKAYVLGQSFGGRVAIDLALSHPQLVAALVLGAPSVGGHDFSNEVQLFEAEEEAALERGDLDAATELNLRMWVDGPRRGPDEVDPAVRELVRGMVRQGLSVPMPEGVSLRSLTPPAIARLGEITVPTLVIVGELDAPEFLRLSEVVTAAIPGAKRVVVPGVAHLPNLEKSRQFNRLVLDFLAGLQ